MKRCREKVKGCSQKEKKNGQKKGFQIGNKQHLKRFKNKIDIQTAPKVARASKRLQAKREENEKKYSCEYFICKKQKMDFLWNQGFCDHSELNEKCKGHLKLKKKNQLIISGTWCLYCDVCDWESSSVKMYDEHLDGDKRDTRGRKSSTLNDSLGFALLSSPIGASVFREICLNIGIDPGSESGLCGLITRCGDKMLLLGESVLTETRAQVVQQFSNDWDITLDTKYNNKLRSANTPFAGGTQAATTAIEEISGDRNIVDVVTASKIDNRTENLKVNDNTIILQQQDHIGSEGAYSAILAQRLKRENINVRTVGSDADCNIRAGIRQSFENCEFQIDSRHYSESQRKKTKASVLSDQMFEHNHLKKITKKRKDRYKGYFAGDLSSRCNVEFNCALRQCKNKKKKTRAELKTNLKKLLKQVPSAIVDCYMGKHNKCKKYSYACRPENIWVKEFLPQPLRRKMNMTPSDRLRVEYCAELRLGEPAIEQTYLNMNTQKCEATNRKYNKFCPKDVTSRVNFRPRILAAVIHSNLGSQEASRRMQTVAKHDVCGSINKKLKAQRDIQLYRKNYRKSQRAKTMRTCKKMNLTALHIAKNDDQLFSKPGATTATTATTTGVYSKMILIDSEPTRVSFYFLFLFNEL